MTTRAAVLALLAAGLAAWITPALASFPTPTPGAPTPATHTPAAATAALDLPARWDWREQGGVTPVRNMGWCDATWCFAAVGAVESLLLIEEGRATDLSEQQVLACIAPGRGCHGGWMHEVYRFIRDEGIAAEDCFPYTGWESARCTDHACPTAAVIAGWVDVPNDVAAIKAAVRQSPVTTAMLMPVDFPTYNGAYCLGDGPLADQAEMLGVLIVGWDDALCGGGGWICKFCLGTGWGDGGYFTVRYGAYGIGDHAQRPLYSSGTRLRGHIDLLADAITGNGDTWPDPGERITLWLSVRNGPFAAARTDLAVSGRVLAGPATAAPASWQCGPLAADASADLQPIWPVDIDRTAAFGDTVRVELRYTDAGAPAGADTLAFAVGHPWILIVDDDEGEHLETWYTDAVSRARYPFRVWDESRLGPVSSAELERYRAVVWFEGLLGRINEDNYLPIATYLQQGGRLFLSGQDIGWWLVEMGDSASRHFYEAILQAAYLADDSGLNKVTGVAGVPIGDGLVFGLGGPGGSQRQDYPDLIAPLEGAQSAFTYAPGLTAGIRSSAIGRLLYCGFGFEAIDEAAARDTLMTRTLRWLAGPPPDFTPPRVELLSPRGGERFAAGSTQAIRWRATDDRGGVLFYAIERSFDGGATWPDRIGSAAGSDTSFAWSVGDSLAAAERIRVSARNAAGLWGEAISGPFSVVSPVPPDARPLVLLGAAPNPFNSTTEIRCLLGRPADRLTVGVFDARGRRVRLITAGPQPAGPATVLFDGRDGAGRQLPSGLYGYRVAVPGAEVNGRLSLVK